MHITIHIDDNKVKKLKEHYNTDDDRIVIDATEDILERYLVPEFLNPDLMLEAEMKTLK